MTGLGIDAVEAIGYLGTALTITASAMTTMIPLRIIALVASAAVITYGMLIGSWPVVLTEAIQIPFNAFRLWQMIRLVRQVETAAEGDLSLDWLRPFGNAVRFRAGQTVFRKGDDAGEMFYVESGSFRIPEYGIVVRPGGVVGELGLLSPGNTRTASLVCVEAGQALRISYSEVKQLYYQNPEFGFFFLKLTSERLFQGAQEQAQSRAATGLAAPTGAL
jgi:CRP/FNR family cyclic AMP-dependent transcriptional regulator